MAANGLYNEDGSMRVSVVTGGSSGGGTVAQGAAGTDPWLVSARQSGTWTAAVTQSGAWSVTLAAGNAAIGTVAATQSGTWTMGISAGTASIGTVGLNAGTNVIGSLNNIGGTISLPTGAATSAKQPAFAVAGTPSADVLSVQGTAAGTPISTIPAGSTPLGYVQTAAGDLATSIPLPSIPAGTTVATVIPDGAGVRHRKDGTAPTPASGMPIPVGGAVKLYGAEIAAARFIQQSAGAILNIEYAK